MFEGQGIEGLIGRKFSGFRVTRFIARGGMGVVYEGMQESLNRPVAIKFLYPHLSGDANFRERFEREALASASLTHPNIVRVLDFGSEGMLHFMVMDYIDGESLRDYLTRDRDESLAERLRTSSDIVEQVGNALSHAHRRGYVHRDVKPGNVLLVDDGRALLTDFGVVKIVGESGLTVTGTMVGTPEYMAPEQGLGTGQIEPAADQYSLAVIAYQMMTGRVPFQAPTPAAVVRMQIGEPPPPPTEVVPAFPPSVQRGLMRGLAKEPADRYDTVEHFVDRLTSAVSDWEKTAEVTIPDYEGVVDASIADSGLVEDPEPLEAHVESDEITTGPIASEGGGRFALPSARASRRLDPRHVAASAVPVELRGAGQASRQVNNFCAPDAFEADRLIAVEVLTPGGNWSSYPPHKHDEDVAGVETALEEIYYYEVAGGGFAYQRAYGAGLDICREVLSGDTVLLPHGYHGPSMAAPGYDLYYLNVMAGPGERAWRFTDDPAHAWIRDTWPGQEIDPRLPMARPEAEQSSQNAGLDAPRRYPS
jgi:5-deoxy-glucuronate isomerase